MTSTNGRGDLSRRSFMWATAGSAAAAAGGAGTVSAQEEDGDEENGEEENGEEENGEEENGEEENGEEENGEEENGAADNGDEDGARETVIVGPDGNNVYEPDDLGVEPGTTVEFIWESDTHNLAVESAPDGGWEGYDSIEDAGFEYEHTFEVEGTYDYVCEPHVAAGMEATITVEEGASQGGGGGGGAATTPIPDSAMSLAVGTMGAMVSTLALAYFFIKYGGYDEEVE